MHERIVERYLKLGLRLGRHVDGIVDSYAGPPEIAAAVDAEPLREPGALASDAEELLGELDDGWLHDQVRGLHTCAAFMAGSPGSYADEVEGCYGLRPAHTDEAVFEAAHRELDQLLPGDGPLAERYESWRSSITVPANRIGDIVAALIEEARAWTRGVAPLPEGEGVDLEIVRDRAWLAFCEYQGGLRSRISVNADLPISAFELLHVTCHETYPGHHAERVCKDHLLVRGQGKLEETLVLMPTPQSLVSEGIAELGPELLLASEGAERLTAVLAGAGIELDLRPRARGVAGARAVRMGGGQRLPDAPRGRCERGRGPGLSRALGAHDPGLRRPRDPLHHRAELAHVHRQLLGRARAVPFVRGRRPGAIPAPAHGAGARERPALRDANDGYGVVAM